MIKKIPVTYTKLLDLTIDNDLEKSYLIAC